MFLIIPEIKLTAGICKDTISSDNRIDGYYENMVSNPADLARLLRRENAKSICVTDFDNIGENGAEVLEKLVACLDITTQFNTSASSIDKDIVDKLMSTGIKRLNLYVDGKSIEQYIDIRSSFPDFSIYPIIDSKNLVVFDKIKCERFSIRHRGGNWDHETLKKIIDTKSSNTRITLYGGISDHISLKLSASYTSSGIDSCIIGKPLYDNSFPCQAIWRNIEGEIDSEAGEKEISTVLEG